MISRRDRLAYEFEQIRRRTGGAIELMYTNTPDKRGRRWHIADGTAFGTRTLTTREANIYASAALAALDAVAIEGATNHPESSA